MVPSMGWCEPTGKQGGWCEVKKGMGSFTARTSWLKAKAVTIPEREHRIKRSLSTKCPSPTHAWCFWKPLCAGCMSLRLWNPHPEKSPPRQYGESQALWPSSWILSFCMGRQGGNPSRGGRGWTCHAGSSKHELTISSCSWGLSPINIWKFKLHLFEKHRINKFLPSLIRGRGALIALLWYLLMIGHTFVSQGSLKGTFKGRIGSPRDTNQEKLKSIWAIDSVVQKELGKPGVHGNH